MIAHSILVVIIAGITLLSYFLDELICMYPSWKLASCDTAAWSFMT
jgi:hypothetical protein